MPDRDSAALFPLLADWPEDELRALVDDIDALHSVLQVRLDAAYYKAVMKPENFFSKERSKKIDDAYKAATLDMLGTLSEISSVALLADRYRKLRHKLEAAR